MDWKTFVNSEEVSTDPDAPKYSTPKSLYTSTIEGYYNNGLR